MSYTAAIWYPNSKPSNVEKLQFIQNSAMRLITGCHKASSIDHLLTESKLMPVAEHLSMLCAQFLASCLRPTHPSYETVKIPTGPRTNASGRPMKETLQSKFSATISPFLEAEGGTIHDISYGRVKVAIHAASVRDSINRLKPNPVLGAKAPEVHAYELSLSRIYQTTLAQLHSNKCASLQSYKHFIKSAADDSCPECLSAPHTTSHIFSCCAYPTPLTKWDLWYKPVEAAEFIADLPSFDHLPPLNPQLPRPPPEPDP